jgi:hypothetical protein
VSAWCPQLALNIAMHDATISMGKVTPHSRPHKLALLDGRCAEAKLMREYREELARHCGGHPSVVQKRLIERAAVLHLRIALMDKQSLLNSELSERNSRYYLAWSNALSRLLLKLGLEGADERPAGLASYLAESRNAVVAGAAGRPPRHRTAARREQATTGHRGATSDAD